MKLKIKTESLLPEKSKMKHYFNYYLTLNHPLHFFPRHTNHYANKNKSRNLFTFCEKPVLYVIRIFDHFYFAIYEAHNSSKCLQYTHSDKIRNYENEFSIYYLYACRQNFSEGKLRLMLVTFLLSRSVC